MRNRGRIEGCADRLKAMWRRVPDWRFGQLMCNLLGAAGVDPFFVEDHELFDAMEAALDSMLSDRSQMVNNHIEGVLRNEQ